MKFSIRDLLLVTVIVALAVGWLVDHRRQAMTIGSLKDAEIAASNAFSSLKDLLQRGGFIVEIDPAKGKERFLPTDRPLPKFWKPALPDPKEVERQQVLDALRKKLADESREKYGVP